MQLGCQNRDAKIGDINCYLLDYNISVINSLSNPSTYELFILVFNSSYKTWTVKFWMHTPTRHQNISTFVLTNVLLRSDRFTKQSSAIENKGTEFLPQTQIV